MSTVAAVARVPLPSGGSGAFERALRDPRVRRVAKSLNVDLADPATLQSLFVRARDAVEASAPVASGTPAEAAPGVNPDTIPNHYVRHAIRAYQDVLRMA